MLTYWLTFAIVMMFLGSTSSDGEIVASPTIVSDFYWISPSGLDATDCNEAVPCKTINYVLENLASSGDVIYVLPGVYREQVDINVNNVTLQGVGDNVFLLGSQIPGLIEAEGKYKAEWHWGNSYQGTSFCDNLTQDVALDERHCNTLGFWQEGNRFEQVFSKETVTAGTFYYDFEAEEVWLIPFGNNSDLEKIEGLAFPYVVRLNASSSGVTLNNLNIWYGASMPDDGILHIEGSAHELLHLDVRYSAGGGVLVYGADQVNIENVNASEHGQNGWRVRADASFSASSGWEINDWVEDLDIVAGGSTHNGWQGFDNCWGGGGTKFSFTQDLNITSFYSADNNGFGIWLDIENHDTHISESMSARDAGRGIFIEYISDNSTVENNVVYNTQDADHVGCGISVGLAVADSRVVLLKNNTVYSTAPDVKGMMLKTGCSTCRSFPYPSEEITWENNLLINKADAGFVRDLDAGAFSGFTFINTVMEEEEVGDNNLFKCWDSLGDCSLASLGIMSLPKGSYLEDVEDECGFAVLNDAVAGVGAQSFIHPRAAEVCGVIPSPIAPHADFDFEINDTIVSFTDESTGDAGIIEWHWVFGDSTTSSDQNPVHTYTEAGFYIVSLTVKDENQLEDTVVRELEIVEAGEGPFLEVDGRVVIEAEHFQFKQANLFTADEWVFQDLDPAADTVFSMQVLEDDGDTISHSFMENNAELAFPVLLHSTGVFYVWIRAWVVEGGSSIYAGNESHNTRIGVMFKGGGIGEWRWLGHRNPERRAQVEVTDAGVTNFFLWMREDGIMIDRLLLTTDPDYVPTGVGPAESPRSTELIEVRAQGGGLQSVAHNEQLDAVASEFFIHPPYPNPGRHNIVFHMDLPHAGLLDGAIYDLVGRKVKEIPIRAYSEGVQQQLALDVDNLPAGQYLYRLNWNSGSATETKTGSFTVLR